jgi:hypothetical protein
LGREFATGDIDASKILFGKVAAERVPLIKAIVKALHATADGILRGVLPGPAAPRVHRRGGPPAAGYRHRVGPLR